MTLYCNKNRDLKGLWGIPRSSFLLLQEDERKENKNEDNKENEGGKKTMKKK